MRRERPDKARRVAAHRARLDALKLAAGCADCGYAEHPAALHWDHLDPTTKDRTPTSHRALHPHWSWERIAATIATCEVVCANCHAIRTAARGYGGGRPRVIDAAS